MNRTIKTEEQIEILERAENYIMHLENKCQTQESLIIQLKAKIDMQNIYIEHLSDKI